ncbi:MAG: FtsX-like permease family protein [Desulfatiglandales bacterium]
MTTLRMAWRSLGRNRRRSLLAVGAIALAQTTLVLVNGFMAGSYDQMLHTITGPMVGHVQVHHPQWRAERAVERAIDRLDTVRAQLSGLPEVETVAPRIYATVLSASGEEGDRPADADAAVIVGVDPLVESDRGGLLESLPAYSLPRGDTVVIGRVLANRLRVKEGSQLALIGQDVDGFPAADLFHIEAVMESRVDLVQTRGVVMSMERAAEFLVMPGRAHEIVVRGSQVEHAGDLARAVASLPALAGLEVLSWREAAPEFARMIDMKAWVDLVFLAVVFVAAAAGIANTAMMSTFERTREFGMLLAIGSRPARVVRLVLVESVFLGLIGVAVGSLAGTGLVLLFAHTGIDYAALAGVDASDVSFVGVSISYIIYPRLELQHIVSGLLAVTLTSVLAATWPAMLAARLEPAKAMRP